MISSDFYKGKKVFVTGHTGFKGSWLCLLLNHLNAQVCGYALPAEELSMFNLCDIKSKIKHHEGDIRDLDKLKQAITDFQPDIVIHMAAQPLVRLSYSEPVYTYETNVMGTVNILEACRECSSIKSIANVTTDKVYKNVEQNKGYVETDFLDGRDPYSNSKSCSELVTHSYKQSFFDQTGVAVSTCRAGNVIGGGDFAEDRIIPDCVRAFINDDVLSIRNPNSVRPYQYVLEPLLAYLDVAQKQYNDINYASCYNIGPEIEDCLTTGVIVEKYKECQTKHTGKTLKVDITNVKGPHEAGLLMLDCSKIKEVFGWKPNVDIDYAIDKIVEWSYGYANNADMYELSNIQIQDFCSKAMNC